MIVRSLCNTCFQTYELRFSLGARNLLVQMVPAGSTTCPCPRHCGGRINIVNDPGMDAIQKGTSLKQPLVLSEEELYAALNGLPLPDEVPRDRIVIQSLLKGATVKDVVVEEHAGTFYLHEIILDGIVIHLTAGGHGAQVLKITKEG